MDVFIQLVLNSIIAGAVYSIVAIGFNLIYGTTKFVNAAHGVLAAVAGYAVFFLSKEHSLGLVLSIVLGVFAAGVLGWLIDKLVYKPLRARRASNLVMFIASLGMMIVIQALIAIIFTSQFQSIGNDVFSNVINIFGGAITVIQIIIIICGLGAFGGLMLLLNKTRFGKAVKAVSDDEEVARIIGIDTNKIIGRTFFLGSALSGLAGILVGIDTGLQPTMGFMKLLEAAIASIIGGLGSVPGAFLGAYLLGFVENFGIWKIASEWKWAISFGLLIIFLIFKPQGILGKRGILGKQ